MLVNILVGKFLKAKVDSWSGGRREAAFGGNAFHQGLKNMNTPYSIHMTYDS